MGEVLTPAGFEAKWAARFADNSTGQIGADDFREFGADAAATFAALLQLTTNQVRGADHIVTYLDELAAIPNDRLAVDQRIVVSTGLTAAEDAAGVESPGPKEYRLVRHSGGDRQVYLDAKPATIVKVNAFLIPVGDESEQINSFPAFIQEDFDYAQGDVVRATVTVDGITVTRLVFARHPMLTGSNPVPTGLESDLHWGPFAPLTAGSGAPLTFATILAALGYTPANKAGDTFTGLVLLNAASQAASGAPNRAVTLNDLNLLSTLATSWKADNARAATITELPACTYSNGAKTLTANANGALPAQDGVTLIVGDSLLVKNQEAPATNGPYLVTQLGAAGSAGSAWVLTRRADADTIAKLANATLNVEEGTSLADSVWTCTVNRTGSTLGTTALNWIDRTASMVSPGTSLSLTGGVMSVIIATLTQALTGTATKIIDAQVLNQRLALMPVGNTVSANYTLVAADFGKRLKVSSSSDVIITVPSLPGLAVDSFAHITRAGTGKVTLVGSGATLNSAGNRLRIAERHGTITVLKDSATEYLLDGALIE